MLVPEDFGLVTAALTIIAMLDAALDLGVGAAVVAEQEKGISYRTRSAYTLNLALSLLIAGAGVAASPLIAALFKAESHAGLFALIFLYPLFRGAGQVNDAVLKRDLQFKRRTLVDVGRALVRVAVSVPLALTVGRRLEHRRRDRGQRVRRHDRALVPGADRAGHPADQGHRTRAC